MLKTKHLTPNFFALLTTNASLLLLITMDTSIPSFLLKYSMIDWAFEPYPEANMATFFKLMYLKANVTEQI